MLLVLHELPRPGKQRAIGHSRCPAARRAHESNDRAAPHLEVTQREGLLLRVPTQRSAGGHCLIEVAALLLALRTRNSEPVLFTVAVGSGDDQELRGHALQQRHLHERTLRKSRTQRQQGAAALATTPWQRQCIQKPGTCIMPERRRTERCCSLVIRLRRSRISSLSRSSSTTRAWHIRQSCAVRSRVSGRQHWKRLPCNRSAKLQFLLTCSLAGATTVVVRDVQAAHTSASASACDADSRIASSVGRHCSSSCCSSPLRSTTESGLIGVVNTTPLCPCSCCYTACPAARTGAGGRQLPP